MLRAQTAAASLAASLEVLTRFISTALQSAQRTGIEEEVLRARGLPQPESAPAQQRHAPSVPVPMAAAPRGAPSSAAGPDGQTSLFPAAPPSDQPTPTLIYPE